MNSFFKFTDKLKPFYDITYNATLFVCKLLLIADILIASFAVSTRLPFMPSAPWSEEVVLTLMSYMAVLSAALAIRRNAHIRMTAFDKYLPKKLVDILDIAADIAVFILAIIMLVVGWQYTITLGSFGKYTSMPWLSRFWMYLPIPVAGVAMMIFQFESFCKNLKKLLIKETTQNKEEI